MPGSAANCAGSDAAQARHAPRREQEPGASAGQRQHQAFGQHLLHEPDACAADRHPDGELFLAAGRARQEQRGDVRAGDQQDEADRAEQHQQRRPHVADQGVAERPEARGVTGVFLGVRAAQPRADDRHFFTRLGERNRRDGAAPPRPGNGRREARGRASSSASGTSDVGPRSATRNDAGRTPMTS